MKMIIKNIRLRNFRLHKNTDLQFSNNLNYIIGGNGQGKTTILEAIYYLCTTINLSRFSDSEAVSFDELKFEVEGEFKGLTENKIQINFNKDINKKNIFLNGKQIYRASSIIGKFPVVTLTQLDHAITLGSPSDRRKFVDSVIAQASKTYLKNLISYQKTLKQRSSLLSKIKETKNFSLIDQLDAWTENLILYGTQIVKHRIKFIEEFNQYIEESYYKIMSDVEKPKVTYRFLDCENEEEIEEKFREAIKEKKEKELKRAANLVGPHRDDFLFNINRKELKKFGSQGQHKTFQIALKFGQFFYLKNKVGTNPVFLMDDVFGELDIYRAKKISEYLKEISQAFITMTDFTNTKYLFRLPEDLLIKVENGKAVYA